MSDVNSTDTPAPIRVEIIIRVVVQDEGKFFLFFFWFSLLVLAMIVRSYISISLFDAGLFQRGEEEGEEEEDLHHPVPHSAHRRGLILGLGVYMAWIRRTARMRASAPTALNQMHCNIFLIKIISASFTVSYPIFQVNV